MTIRTKLVAAIALLIATIVAVSVFAYVATEKEAAIANTIVGDRVVPLEQLKSIADAYAVNIVDAVHKVRGGTSSAAEGVHSIVAAADIVDRNWSAYMATYLTPEEAGLAKDFAAARQAADAEILKIRAIVEKGDAAAIADLADSRLYATIDPLGAKIAKLVELQIRVAKQEQVKAEALKDSLTVALAALSALAAAIAAFSIWTVIRGVVRPLNAISDAMAHLASGKLDIAIYGEGRRDEIGHMASAVACFRDNALACERLEAEAETNRAQTERDRIAAERRQAQEAAEIKAAVDNIAAGLDALAEGRLNYRISTPFAERLDKVRDDFNAAMGRIEEAIGKVGQNARGIAAGSNEIKAAADDLSRRTEQQAASVE